MRNRIFAVSAVLALLALFSTPTTASADWTFTPYIGVVKGGSTSTTSSPTTFGASLTGMGSGIAGFELDFGYAPNFFGPSTPEFGDNNVTTFMGNVIVGVPVGGQHGPGIRPYGVAGVGLVRQRATSATQAVSDLSTSDFGFDLGAGVLGFFSDNIGLRGDVRYIRNFSSNSTDTLVPVSVGTLNFWRLTAGVAFRF
jgi:opacity protein-like surface antigen